MLNITTTSRPGGDKPNEDWAGCTNELVVVLDGLSTPEGVGGCHHGTPWYVEHLGEQLLARGSASTSLSLREALRSSIEHVASEHRATCDLANPGTPSSTVALIRSREDRLETLVLADSPVVVDTATGIKVFTDQRVDQVVQRERDAVLSAPAGSEEKQERLAALVRVQQQIRNTEGGYWVAQADGIAADHALESSWAIDTVHRFAAMTDGVSCLVELYQDMSWNGLLDMAGGRGVSAVVDRIRQIEASDPCGTHWPRYKEGDDATLAYGQLV